MKPSSHFGEKIYEKSLSDKQEIRKERRTSKRLSAACPESSLMDVPHISDDEESHSIASKRLLKLSQRSSISEVGSVDLESNSSDGRERRSSEPAVADSRLRNSWNKYATEPTQHFSLHSPPYARKTSGRDYYGAGDDHVDLPNLRDSISTVSGSGTGKRSLASEDDSAASRGSSRSRGRSRSGKTTGSSSRGSDDRAGWRRNAHGGVAGRSGRNGEGHNSSTTSIHDSSFQSHARVDSNDSFFHGATRQALRQTLGGGDTSDLFSFTSSARSASIREKNGAVRTVSSATDGVGGNGSAPQKSILRGGDTYNNNSNSNNARMSLSSVGKKSAENSDVEEINFESLWNTHHLDDSIDGASTTRDTTISLMKTTNGKLGFTKGMSASRKLKYKSFFHKNRKRIGICLVSTILLVTLILVVALGIPVWTSDQIREESEKIAESAPLLPDGGASTESIMEDNQSESTNGTNGIEPSHGSSVNVDNVGASTADGNKSTIPFLKPPPPNLQRLCGQQSLSDKEGYESCLAACLPSRCCMLSEGETYVVWTLVTKGGNSSNNTYDDISAIKENSTITSEEKIGTTITPCSRHHADLCARYQHECAVLGVEALLPPEPQSDDQVALMTEAEKLSLAEDIIHACSKAHLSRGDDEECRMFCGTKECCFVNPNHDEEEEEIFENNVSAMEDNQSTEINGSHGNGRKMQSENEGTENDSKYGRNSILGDRNLDISNIETSSSIDKNSTQLENSHSIKSGKVIDNTKFEAGSDTGNIKGNIIGTRGTAETPNEVKYCAKDPKQYCLIHAGCQPLFSKDKG